MSADSHCRQIEDDEMELGTFLRGRSPIESVLNVGAEACLPVGAAPTPECTEER